MKIKPTYKIPFDINGELCNNPGKQHVCLDTYDADTKKGKQEYTEYFPNRKLDMDFSTVQNLEVFPARYGAKGFEALFDPIEKDNFAFEAEMQYTGYGRGRSSALMFVTDLATYLKYPIFMTDWNDVVKTLTITKGKLEKARWTFIKRGENYAIKLD